jgi:hypothetical protein
MKPATLYVIGEPSCWVGAYCAASRRLLRWTGERQRAARFTREDGAAALESIRAALFECSPEAAACAKRLRLHPARGGYPAEV